MNMVKAALDSSLRILEIPEGKGPFLLVSKKYFEELRKALEAIVKGEEALRNGKTRSFRSFVKKEFPEYAERV
ncbi:hypothetical protein HYV91_03380 [Candidatus Wolfebacteria bacterium]|nr:hypothetical protein [Candidatus Wolfebacteria bacterium]